MRRCSPSRDRRSARAPPCENPYNKRDLSETLAKEGEDRRLTASAIRSLGIPFSNSLSISECKYLTAGTNAFNTSFPYFTSPGNICTSPFGSSTTSAFFPPCSRHFLTASSEISNQDRIPMRPCESPGSIGAEGRIQRMWGRCLECVEGRNSQPYASSPYLFECGFDGVIREFWGAVESD